MKISRKDLESLRFAVMVLSSLAKATAEPAKSESISQHANNLRKINFIILQALNEPPLDFEKKILEGLAKDSATEKGLKAIAEGSQANG